MQRTQLTYITVGAVSFATILFELLQTRVLSFIFWNHLVYLSLSSALLGFGISGTITAIFIDKIEDRDVFVSKLLTLFGLTALSALMLTYLLPILSDNLLILKILLAYLVYLPPFVFAGAAISILLASSGISVGRLYAVDLLCAGFACIAFFFLLPLLEPDKLTALLAVTMGYLGLLWGGEKRRLKLMGFSVTSLGLAVFICTLFIQVPLIPESYKELHEYIFARGQIETTIWTPLCRIDVTNLQNKSGSVKQLTQDGSAHTHLISDEDVRTAYANARGDKDPYPGAMAWAVKTRPDVAIIGVGGGVDVLEALAHDSKSVVSAELNPATYDLVARRYSDYNGHFTADKRLTPLFDEGRNMLRQQTKSFDIIQVIGIDTFAALSSGAFVLSENYLYTTEAFQEMFNHLKSNGILSFGRWNTYPPKESLRLVSIAMQAMRLNGYHNLSQHTFVFFTDNEWAVCLFKKTPFTAVELEMIKAEAAKKKLPIISWPKVLPNKKEQDSLEAAYYKDKPARLQDMHKIFDGLIDSYTQGKEAQFFQSYPTLLTPSSDDSPFFFEYAKDAFAIPDLRDLRGNAANLTLYLVLVQSLFFTVAAILFPLFKFRRQTLNSSMVAFSSYFAAIGMGFMLVEIALMQKFVLFLGNPLYSLPVVLASLLVSGGVGSWIVAKLNWPVKKVALTFGTLLTMALLLAGFRINSVFYSLHLEPPVRMLISGIIICPLGVLMGMFMPSGLAFVREQNSAYVPWVWGINGCASVLGSFAAILIAISSGFTSVFICGALLYALATISALFFRINPITLKLTLAHSPA